MSNMTTVYLIVERGFVSEAYSTDENIDVVVLDRDTQDKEMLANVNHEIARVKEKHKEIEIY